MKSLWTTITGAGNGRRGRSAGVEGVTRERVDPPGSRDTGVNGVPARGAPEFATTPPESPPRTGVSGIAGATHATLAAYSINPGATFGPCPVEWLADTRNVSAGRRGAARSSNGPPGHGRA
jgi:hypothetical protein